MRTWAWIFFGTVFFPLTLNAASILTLPHKTETLPNGLRVFLVKYPSPNTIAYQIPVKVGSRNEVEKGKTGFAHFFEHLMFRGTKTMTGKAFGDMFAKMGAEYNAWTWLDMTNYHGVVASVYLPKALTAEADRFQNLAFDEKLLKDEAGAVLGEYNKDVAQPEFVLEEKLMSTAFLSHTYGHSTMGVKEDILKFTERYKDVWPFFRRYYRPGNVAVILVGDVDFDKHMAMIKEKFGGWKNPEGLEPVEISEEAKQTAARTGSVKLTKPTQTRITIAYKSPAFTTKNADSATLALLAEMAFSTTSEFQKTFRYEKKWLDSVDANPLPTLDPGLWSIGLRFSEAGEAHRDEVVSAVEQALESLKQTPPTAERLADTKKRFRNSAVTNWFRSPEALAGRIAWYTNYEADLEVINRMFDRTDEVTPDMIRDYAKKYLVETGKTTITLEGKAS